MNTKADMPITDEQIAEIEALAFTTHASTADLFAYARETNPSKILALISRLRAAEMDAVRWRYARDILTVEAIETAQSEFISFGLPAAESESLRVDAAIDAAMKGEQQ